MGIFDLFKKQKKQVEEKTETINRDNLSAWLLNKRKQHQEKEEDFMNPVKERISQLISELKSEMLVLEKIDLDSKKIDHRVKLIIQENLKNYLRYLDKMIERLGEINRREKVVEKINFIFDDFHKRSKISYEKITFIVGKEMQATKISTNNFLQDLERILINNAKDFEEFEIIQILEQDLEKLTNSKKEKQKILEDLNGEVRKLKSLEENLRKKEEEIKDLKQSEKFKKEEDKFKEIKTKKQELEKKINYLYDLIDFKALSNFYHKFEKEMKLVKEYRENFKQLIETSQITNLIRLLKEANLYPHKIHELIKEIEEEQKQISEISINDFGVKNLEKEIERIQYEIKSMESERLAKEKKLKSLDEELNEFFKSIKENSRKINLILE